MIRYPDTESDTFWEGVRARLTPVVGDVSDLLGEQWTDVVGKLFCEQDFMTAAAVQGLKGRTPTFTIAEIAARHVSGNLYTAAHSPGEALAHVIQLCEESKYRPDRVEIDEDAIRLTVGEQPLALLYPLKESAIGEQDRRRAESTITKLRDKSDPARELINRLNQWPGIESLQIVENRSTDGRLFVNRPVSHLPIPPEWLISANKLCALCGISDAPMRLRQETAAAVLGAASWNHVAGPAAAKGASAYSPWQLTLHADASSAREILFTDVFAATAALIRMLPEVTRGWSQISVDPGRSSGWGGAAFGVSEQSARITAHLNYPYNVSIYPVETTLLSPEDQDLVARCEEALQSRSESALAGLLRINLPAQPRIEAAENSEGELLVAESGPWRFFVDPKNFCVRRYDVHGNRVLRAFAPLHEAAIMRHHSGLYVLTSEYNLNRPVAVVKGLGKEALDAIKDVIRVEDGSLYPWMGSPADEAISAAGWALLHGEDVDLGALDLKQYDRVKDHVRVRQPGA